MNNPELQIRASRTARFLHLPWLSWTFLALLLAASLFVQPGKGMRAPSTSAAANPAIAATR